MKETVVFTFGRMNPPTIGHAKLVDKVKEIAGRMNADPHIYLSHTKDKKKNPLEYREKIKFAQSAFGPAVKASGYKTLIDILKYLEKQGYKKAVMVVGSDRVADFRQLLNKYNGKDFNFESISVVSAGERDPDADSVEGMSASKVRALARTGKYSSFAQGLPAGLSNTEKKKIYNNTNIGRQHPESEKKRSPEKNNEKEEQKFARKHFFRRERDIFSFSCL